MALVTKLSEPAYLGEGESFTKDKLINFIKEKESFRSKAYWDNDHYSIGYGTKASGPDETISKKVAEQRLIKDIDTREKFVRNFAKNKGYDWNDSQVNSLVDFHFNTGQENFLALTDKGNRTNEEIAAKIPEYNLSKGKFNQGLQNRRWQNQLAFTTPTETNSLENFANGAVEEGNIDLTKRPVVKNKDGSISTVRSMSFNDGKNEVLIPTVSNDGRIMSDEEAIKTYQQSGKHLGKFGSVDAANTYAESLHKDQEKMYAPKEQQASSVFVNTPPIQVASNTNPNVATDVPTTSYEIPKSSTERLVANLGDTSFSSELPTPQTPFNKDFNGSVYKALAKSNKQLAGDYVNNITALVNNNTLPSKDFNGQVYKNLMQTGNKELAQQYYNDMNGVYSQLSQVQKPATETPPAEPVKQQGALRVAGQSALKEVIPTGIGYGLSELIGGALAPETGGASLALVPLAVNLATRIGSFVAGHAGGSALQKNVLPEAVNKTLEQGEAQHPTAAMIGGFLPFGLYGGYGLSTAARKEIGEALDLAKKGDYTKVKQFKTWSEPTIQAGFGAGIEGLTQAVHGEFDPGRILVSGFMMPLVSGDKTKLGKALTFENIKLRPKETADELISKITKREFFVPKEVEGIDIVNMSKESKAEYAGRHNIAETEVDTHQQQRSQNNDSVRVHETTVTKESTLTKDANDLLKSVDEGGVPGFMTSNLRRIAKENGIKVEPNTKPNEIIDALQAKRQAEGPKSKPTIEVDYKKTIEEFAHKAWTKLYDLPENAFNDFQSYLDFKIHRAKNAFQEPESAFNVKNKANLTEPAPEGHTTVYRGEYSGPARDIPDWIKEQQKESGHTDAEGRWWTTDPEIADWYAKEAGDKGRVFYQHVPNNVVEASKVSKADPTVQSYSRDVNNELFLPKEYIGMGKPLDKTYTEYLNDRAMEDAATSPFFNLDNLGLPPTPKNEKELADGAFISANAKMIDHMRGTKLYQVVLKEGLTPEMQDNIRQYLEGVRPNLSVAEKAFYEKYYKPLNDELTKAYEYLRTINPELANQLGDMRDGKLFFSRMMNPLTREQIKTMQANGTIEDPNFFGKIKNTFAELGGKLEGGFDPDLGKLSSASKTRSFWVIENKNGSRDVVQISKDGKIFKWEDQQAKLIGRMPYRDQLLKEGDTFFGGKLAQGTIEELEQHAPVSYNRNSFAVLIEKMNQAREEVRQDAYLRELMASPMMKEIAIPTHENDRLKDIPEGYAIPKNVQKYPPLAGYMFPVRVANIINDFAKVWEPTVLTNLTNIVVKNMMVNPIAHMLNEAFHLFNARGLSGWVTPGGIARFQKYTTEAINDVVNLSDFYEETIRLGGALLSPNTRSSAFQDAIFGKGLNEFSKTGEFKELANDLGVSLKQLYNNISKQSNRAMWITRDVMYMQYLREVMATKGMSHAEAIQYAERHIPNYRLPSMIGEKVVGENMGRGLSYIMQNPNISVFSRYHYGMVKSLINMVQEVGAIRKGAEGMKEFKQGVDSAAAVAVALAVMYPLMDMAAKSLTDNDKAKFRRAGPYHLIHAMEDVVSGAKSPAAAMNSVFTFNPALSGLVQFGMNTNFYNGQPIYNPQSDPVTLASDIARYAGMQLPMASQALRAQTDKTGEGFSTAAARQIDIEAPTAAQYVSTEKRKRDAAKDALRRNLERQMRGGF